MKPHKVTQNTHEWHELRRGKPTASMFGQVVTEKDLLKAEIIDLLSNSEYAQSELKKKKVDELHHIARLLGVKLNPKLAMSKTDYHFKLASEILYGYDCDEWLGNAHTDHGHESEMIAAKSYMDIMGMEPEQVGFVTDDEETIGCSPDRFVGENGLMEIKAPLAKNVVKIFATYKETGECPTDHKMQIQGQLMITGREWCDLVLYHPRATVKIIRVFPDFDLHEKLKEQLKVLMKNRDTAAAAMADY